MQAGYDNYWQIVFWTNRGKKDPIEQVPFPQATHFTFGKQPDPGSDATNEWILETGEVKQEDRWEIIFQWLQKENLVATETTIPYASLIALMKKGYEIRFLPVPVHNAVQEYVLYKLLS